MVLQQCTFGLRVRDTRASTRRTRRTGGGFRRGRAAQGVNARAQLVADLVARPWKDGDECLAKMVTGGGGQV